MSLIDLILNLVDFILNAAGLLLWLNWRAAALPLRGQPGSSLLSTLRPAGPVRPRFYHWAGLPLLLAGRALFYWQAGPPAHWNPHLPLGPLTLSFRSDSPGRMFLFSLLSFVAAWWVCHLWLVVLSCVNTRISESDPTQRLLRAWLGGLERWPMIIKLILPALVAPLLWYGAALVLIRAGLLPPNPAGALLGQGVVVGLSGYLTLKFLITALLLLYLLNSYVYLGELAVWGFVNTTARRLLRPLQWLPLRMGKIDLGPVLFIVLVVAAAEFAQRGLIHLYQRWL